MKEKTRFQHLVIDRFLENFMERMQREEDEKDAHERILVITERSLKTNVDVFIQRETDIGNIESIDGAILSWKSEAFHEMMLNQYNMEDLYVYLKSDPSKCLDRIQARARAEETDMNRVFLDDLHQRHEILYRKLDANDKRTLILDVDRLVWPNCPPNSEIMINAIVTEIMRFVNRNRYLMA